MDKNLISALSEKSMTRSLNEASIRTAEFYETSTNNEPLQYRAIENLSDGRVVAIKWKAKVFKDHDAYNEFLNREYIKEVLARG